MSEPVTRTRQAIAEEAAEWFVELRGAPAPRAVKDQFVSWLSESPVHVEEYLGVAKVFAALQHIGSKEEIDAAGLADQTVVALHGDAGVDGLMQGVRETGSGSTDGSGVPVSRAGGLDQQDFGGEVQQQDGDGSQIGERKRGRGLLYSARSPRLWASAASIVLLIAAAALIIQRAGPQVYATALGEQRSVVLSDGSLVSLNTSTIIEVAYSNERRQVHLAQGEALFEVEKDPSRPFWVETDSAMIRVTGTRFNVYQHGKDTAVTVLEGRVQVMHRGAARQVLASSDNASNGSSGSSGGGVASLEVGDQAVVKRGSAEITTLTITNLEPVMAWTERRLVFDSTPLSEIVQQFNRYNRERLVIEDPILASLELSGVFRSGDPESLVLFLKRISDVDIVTSADGQEIRIRAARTAR